MGSAKFKYHPKMEFKHFKNDRDIPSKFINEEKKICDWFEPSRVFRESVKFLKNRKYKIGVEE